MSKSLVYTYLIEAARNRETITYRELARKVGLYGDMPRLFRILDDINRDERAAGRPMLSAIVVGASGMPGKGFFRLARSLGLYRGIDDRGFWQEEVRRVHNHWETGRANVQYYSSYTGLYRYAYQASNHSQIVMLADWKTHSTRLLSQGHSFIRRSSCHSRTHRI